MTVVQYEQAAPLPPSKPGEELLPGPTGDVARLRAAAEYASYIGDTEFVPETLRGRPAAITAALLAGDELGLKKMAALRTIAIIKGRPALSAEAQRGLVLAAGHELWFDESTVTRAIAAGRRAGSDRIGRVTWTMDDAKRAGLAGQPNFRAYPAEMLRARASAALARAMFADVTLGIPASEELEGLDLENGPPAVDAAPPPPDAPATPAAPTRARRRAPRAASSEVAKQEAPEPDRPPLPPTPPPDTQPEPPIPAEPLATDAYKRQIFALMRDLEISDRQERLDLTAAAIGRTVESSNELTIGEAGLLIEALKARRDTGADTPADPQAAPDAAAATDADEAATGLLPELELAELIQNLVGDGKMTIDQLWRAVATQRGVDVGELAAELQARREDGTLRVGPLIRALSLDEIGLLIGWLREVDEKPPPEQLVAGEF